MSYIAIERYPFIQRMVIDAENAVRYILFNLINILLLPTSDMDLMDSVDDTLPESDHESDMEEDETIPMWI